MSEARRSGKEQTGRAAYFAAGGKLLLRHPVRPFDVAITTTSGSVVDEQVCEAIAVRVAELNRWRPGGGLNFPFLRLATVAGDSRSRLARAILRGPLSFSAGRATASRRKMLPESIAMWCASFADRFPSERISPRSRSRPMEKCSAPPARPSKWPASMCSYCQVGNADGKRRGGPTFASAYVGRKR